MLHRLERALLPLARRSPALHERLLNLKDRLRGASEEDRRRRALNRKVVSLTPEDKERGRVLLSLLVEPFLVAAEEIPHHHTRYWEAREIARAFLEMDYAVDVIRWTNRRFLPARPYDLLLDPLLNLERLAPHLGEGCTRVLHADAAHWLFHTTAQHRRLLDLQRRRGVTLPPSKVVAPNLGIEHAHCATVLGNEFTLETFRYAGKPLYRVPLSAPRAWPWPEGKDFDAHRRRFLWFGSDGFVHKGLDLVLEAFAGMPDHHLTVCGPLEAEPAFTAAFRRELYETPNIETRGFVDIADPAFLELARRTLAVVFPSCSEGGGGGVITCMHAALIPAVTREASVDLGDFGLLISEPSVEGVRAAARRLASLPAAELARRARGAWELARAQHTRESFARAFRRVAEDILAGGFRHARHAPVPQPEPEAHAATR